MPQAFCNSFSGFGRDFRQASFFKGAVSQRRAGRIEGGNFTIKVNRLARGYLDSEKAKEGILPSGTSQRSAVV
jgi:hypothetical protein